VIIAVGSLLLALRVLRRKRQAGRWTPLVEPAVRVAFKQRLDALLGCMPARAPMLAEELPAIAAAAAVEACLLAGDARGALAAAEAQVSVSPDEPAGYLLLARALFASDALGPARQVIVRARALGSDAPLLDHLEGRVDQLLWLRRVNPGRPEVQRELTPPLSTPFDRLVVELAAKRGDGAVWLAGQTQTTLSPETVKLLLGEHAKINVRSLELLLRAAERAPGAAEFVYHVARRALQCGFLEEGSALMARLEAMIDALPDADAFARDRAELRGEEPPLPASKGSMSNARRSPALRILK
jgi:hypothetical protein